MSQDSAGALTAASLIRRFKEGQPTSREERERLRSQNGQDRMWWESEGRSHSLSTSRQPPTARSRENQRNPEEDNDVEEPRPGRLRPPMVQPSRRLEGQLGDSGELFRASQPLGNSMDVDYLIEKEIRNLEKDIKKKERETMQRLNMGSFAPVQGLDRSFENGLTVGGGRGSSPPVRYRPTSNMHGGSMDGGFGEDARQRARLSKSGDLFRASLDTLGSTGILGLLQPDLKLDGRGPSKEDAEKAEKKKQTDEAYLGDMQANLEELMKNLAGNLPAHGGDGGGGSTGNETIPEITNRLECQMMEFMSLYNGAILRDKDAEEERKKRDAEKVEEGRRLERERRLLEFDVPPFQHPLDYMGAPKHPPTQPQEGMRLGDVFAGRRHRSSASAAAQSDDDDDHDDDEAVLQSRRHRQSRGNRSEARVLAKVIDYEMAQAEAVQGHLRHVRSHLNSHLHGLRARASHRGEDVYVDDGSDDDNDDDSDDEEFGDRRGSQRRYDPRYVHTHLDAYPYQPRHQHQLQGQSKSARKQKQQQQRKNKRDWNPYPDLLPENIFSTAKGIESALNSAMDTLNKRLPEKRVPMSVLVSNSATASGAISPRPLTPMMPSGAGHSVASNTPVPPSKTPPPPAFPTASAGSTATNVVKPIVTTPTTTAVRTATTTSTAPLPALKTDSTSQIEQVVDAMVNTAKQRVASSAVNPAHQSSGGSNLSSVNSSVNNSLNNSAASLPSYAAAGGATRKLDLSTGGSLDVSAASSISLSSSHELSTARAAPGSTAPTAAVAALTSTSSSVNTTPTTAANTTANAAKSPAAIKPAITASTPVPQSSATIQNKATAPPPPPAPAPATGAIIDPTVRDLEYVDSVLNQADRAPGRFDKYTPALPISAPVHHQQPSSSSAGMLRAITPTPMAGGSATKTVTFASSTPTPGMQPTTPRANTPRNATTPTPGSFATAASAPPMPQLVDALANHNPGLTADLVDPLRELRQRAPHRVYENVLYRPGSLVHPSSSASNIATVPTISRYGGYAPSETVPSAPALPPTVSHHQHYQQPPQLPQQTNMYPSAPSSLSFALPNRAVEGTALRSMHPTYTASDPTTSYGSYNTNSSMGHDSGYGYMPSSAPPTVESSTLDRERFLSQMKTLRQQMSSGGGVQRSPASISGVYH